MLSNGSGKSGRCEVNSESAGVAEVDVRGPSVVVGDVPEQRRWSLPQMQARTTRTIASVGATIDGSGTFSTRTSPAPYIMVARVSQIDPRYRSSVTFPIGDGWLPA
jgi:hypothetical protein